MSRKPDILMLPGNIHDTKSSGKFEILEYLTSRKIKIRFIRTNHIRFCTAGNIRQKEIKDPFFPSVYGIGYLGSGVKTSCSKGRKAYTTWADMLRRCYDRDFQLKNQSYMGCTVSTDWLDYGNFKSWFNINYVAGYELDKDTKVLGNTTYSPSTCVFITKEENLKARKIQ